MKDKGDIDSRRTEPGRRATDSQSEDAQWLAASLDGTPQAFENLVRKYQDRLYDLALRFLHDPAEAEDVVQDAFVQAYSHLKDFSGRSAFSTWLYSIALNRLRNLHRRRRILRWMSLDGFQEKRGGWRARELQERSPSFESQTEKTLQLESIERVVRTFPADYQAIFFMHYFHNLSLDEIGERLGRPAATVKVYLYRARKLLYERLKQEQAVTPSGAGLSN